MARRSKDADGEVVDEISPAEAQAALRVGAAIVIALVLAGPGLIEAARGRRDFAGAAWWFFLSLIAARVAIMIVWSVWVGYRRAIDTERHELEQQRLAKDLDRRRAEAVRAAEEASAAATAAETEMAGS
jgi:hypothetical protein